jgi:hypothetical protein
VELCARAAHPVFFLIGSITHTCKQLLIFPDNSLDGEACDGQIAILTSTLMETLQSFLVEVVIILELKFLGI